MSTISRPEQASVWRGVILGSVAHAVGVARFPNISHEQSWDRSAYSVQGSAGSRGTVAFEGDRFVAVFFYDRSPRNPFASHSEFDLNQLLVGLPTELESLAFKKALQYVLDDIDDRTVPVATAAFWGDGKNKCVSAAEAWEEVWKHGAVLLKNQLLAYADALQAWESEYEFSRVALEVVKRLYELKVKNPTETIELDAETIAVIKASASGPEGVAASRESFKEIGMVLP